MDYNSLNDKTIKIISNLQILIYSINILKKKIILINKINSKLDKNKILKQELNNNLLFQSYILKNEFTYYTNIYNIIIEKYSKDLYELSEYILIIIISLNKLKINIEKKKIIIDKIIYKKKIITKKSGKLNELISNIINNLKVVDEFIYLFNSYIIELKKENTKNNLHNNNFEINIKYKKEKILLEYNKYCDKFIKIINYFMECSDSVINQIETSKLLKFFLKLKLKNNINL